MDILYKRCCNYKTQITVLKILLHCSHYNYNDYNNDSISDRLCKLEEKCIEYDKIINNITTTSTDISTDTSKECKLKCIVCFTEYASRLVLPCNHMCLCTTCCTNIYKCPICNQSIDNK